MNEQKILILYGDVLFNGNSIELSNIRNIMRYNNMKISTKIKQIELIYYAECRYEYNKQLKGSCRGRVSFSNYSEVENEYYSKWYMLL